MRRIFLFVFLFISNTAFAVEKIKGSMGAIDVKSSLIDVVIGLLIVFSIILILSFFIKKMNSFRYKKNLNMKVVGGLALSQKEKIIMIEVEDKKLLLGVSPGRINKLHEFSIHNKGKYES